MIRDTLTHFTQYLITKKEQTFNKDMNGLKNTTSLPHWMHRRLQLYTCFSYTWKIYESDHFLGFEASLAFQMIRIVWDIFFDHKTVKVEINNKKRISKILHVEIK